MYSLIVADGAGLRQLFSSRLIGASYVGIASSSELYLRHSLGSSRVDWPGLSFSELGERVTRLSIAPFMPKNESEAKGILQRYRERRKDAAVELWAYFRDAHLTAKDKLAEDVLAIAPGIVGAWQDLPTGGQLACDSDLDIDFFRPLLGEMQSHPLFLEHVLQRLLCGGPGRTTSQLRAQRGEPVPFLRVAGESFEPTLAYVVPDEISLSLPVPRLSLPPFSVVALESGAYRSLDSETLEEMALVLDSLEDKELYASVRASIARLLTERPCCS